MSSILVIWEKSRTRWPLRREQTWAQTATRWRPVTSCSTNPFWRKLSMLSTRVSFPLASMRCSPISKGSGSTPKQETGHIKALLRSIYSPWGLSEHSFTSHHRTGTGGRRTFSSSSARSAAGSCCPAHFQKPLKADVHKDRVHKHVQALRSVVIAETGRFDDSSEGQAGLSPVSFIRRAL